MKKINITFLILITALFTANAQKDINFKRSYAAGGKLLMNVDSSAKKVYYYNVFPNQPKISFNYLPDAKNVNLQIYFRKNIAIKDFRYTILMDDNKSPFHQLVNPKKNDQISYFKFLNIDYQLNNRYTKSKYSQFCLQYLWGITYK